MTLAEVRRQIAIASEIVKTWPAWKQNILVRSESPTVAVPRKTIIREEPATA